MSLNEIINYVVKRDGKFIGYFPISFPVYVVHVVYNSIDTNPFFPIYKAILRYTKYVDSKHEHLTYFSNLIGFERHFLKKCINKLKEDGCLRWNIDRFVVSDYGIRKYLTPGNRPMNKITGSFLVDGKNLDFLPKVVYDNKRILCSDSVNTGTHQPINLEIDEGPAKRMEKSLKEKKDLHSLGLETDGCDFEVLEFDKKFLKGAFIVFYIDKENKCCKNSIYFNESINCEAFGSTIRYTIDLKDRKEEKCKFKANVGYNVAKEEEVANTALITQNEAWEKILYERYEFVPNTYIHIETQKEKHNLPLIVLSENLLKCCKNPLLMIEDARRNYIDFPIHLGGIVRIDVRNEIQSYVSFKTMIDEWERTERYDGCNFVKRLSSLFSDWRKWMIKFEMYDSLEKIDCDCFILNK